LLIVEFNFRQLLAFASSENLPVSNEPRQPKIEAKKEPVKKLEGKKWIIENGEGNWDLQVEMDQRVHIISSTGKKWLNYRSPHFLRLWLDKRKMQLDFCR
jgi:hypothetical protein